MSKKINGRKVNYFHGDQWFQKQIENRMRQDLPRLQAEGRAPRGTVESLRHTQFYKDEFKRQARLFKKERNGQQEERLLKKQADSLANLAEQKALEERDRVWAQEHEADTDAELLAYMRRCADELGHTPVRREVLGSTYIAGRFGNWSVALYHARLPFPRGMKPPKQTALDAYKKKQKAALK